MTLLEFKLTEFRQTHVNTILWRIFVAFWVIMLPGVPLQHILPTWACSVVTVIPFPSKLDELTMCDQFPPRRATRRGPVRLFS